MGRITRKILLVAPENIRAADQLNYLSERGFQLIEASMPSDIRSKCRQHDFDLVICGPPPENERIDYFAQNGFPEAIPILCLGVTSNKWNDFPGLVCCSPGFDNNTVFHNQVEALARVRELYRALVRKDEKIEELTAHLNRQQQSMKQHSDFLDVLASRDGLTGLYNRRHLNKVLLREFEQYSEQDNDLSLLILDIDYFDELNKRAGRSYGDFVLNDFAARLTSATQPKGLCFRFSGEVFVALLLDTNLAEAISVTESIRLNLAEKPFVRGTERRTITISAGIVSLIEHQPENPDDFITMAERALFTAKSTGRNRLSVYEPVGPYIGNTSQQGITLLKDTLAKILDKTRKSAIESLQLLAREMAGNENRSHIKTVRRYVGLLGRQMNLPEPVIQTFKNAITLHTSIRLLLHSEIIGKREAFSPGERELMNDFPYKLVELTELFDFFASERTILLHHGERFDGSGYPEGLHGEEIPLGARLFSLVDAMAAMNADRPYRQRLKPDEIVQELTDGAGTQFDPKLVIKALEIIKQHQLLDIDAEQISQSIQKIQCDNPDLMS